jgi:BolA family transcriptional regulator, general stress-responsive regulator
MILMKNYFDKINVKLKSQIEIEELEIVDNSHKHKGHKFFSPEKLHLHLKIKSLYLNSISRVNAQKMIMKILKEDLKKKIHALEITIEQ